MRADDEINPDVLGYIFEKYINQKQMGAYYTKEDITEYISKNTVIPFLFDEAKKKCKIAFEGERSVWSLLKEDPDRYIFSVILKGVELPLPKDIAAGIYDTSRRTQWNRPAPQEYALPTESWREVIARRMRCEELRGKLTMGEIQSVEQLVTYNLDIRQFAQDVIENSEGPELLRAFWHAIHNVTILDPTCGSGAFLFAALNILEPLYEACLNRMQAFIEDMDGSGKKHHPEKFSDFRKVLEGVARHPNHKYFVFKSIIISNLYGVDIMEEATEICKLCLFLKLVAQVERVEEIEPLPDIDFNIRAGNTLVGYVSNDEVKKAVTSKLDFDASMERIEEKAQDLDRLFNLFREMQTEHGMAAKSFTEAKQKLRSKLKELEDELNRYLASEYGINPNKKAEYEKWLKTHHPFHWFIEFYGIIKSGGFDVVIGNPPYVEYKDVKANYTVKNLRVQTCSNLFAFVLERCAILAHNNSDVGMIVPLSAFSTDRMIPLISYLKEHSSYMWFSNFGWRPAKLFDGVNLQLSIFIQKIGNPPAKIETTRYLLWNSEARKELFFKAEYIETEDTRLSGSVPKIGSSQGKSILSKIRSFKELGGCFAKKSNNKIYYRRGGLYWKVFVDFETCSSEEKIIDLQPQIDKYIVIAALSSSLWWWYFTITSDCRHLGNRDIETFPFYPLEIPWDVQKELSKLGRQYVEDLKQKSINAVRVYKKTNAVKCLSFRVNQSKKIIDDIDRVLARYYGFTEEELDFIVNYDIEYRMSANTEEED